MSKKRSVLIIKIGAIGDVIMALPMLTAILQKDSTTKITWICGKRAASVLEMTKLVDRLIVVDEKKLLESSFFEKMFEVFQVWKKIGFFRKFSLVVIGYFDIRYRLLTLFTRGKKSFFQKQKAVVEKGNFSESYMPNQYIKLVLDDVRASTLISKDFKDIFPKIQVSQSEKIEKLFSHKIENTTKRVALSCGGVCSLIPYSEVRRWPIESYVELTKRLIDEGHEVILIGIVADEWILPYFKGLKILQLIGKTDIKELLAVYQKCDLVITHDSGALHLALLAQNKILALFGPTSPYVFTPFFQFDKNKNEQKLFVLWGGEDLLCRPCYDGKLYAPCRKNFCMQTLKPEDVFNKAKEILSEKQ